MKQNRPFHIITVIAAALLMFTACQGWPADDASRRKAALAEMRLSRLSQENKLVFVEYTLKELCGSRDETVWRILGDKEVLYSITAHVTAGIDMRKMPSDALTLLDDSTVMLTLPHVEVLGIDIPNSEVRNVYERITGISSDLTAAERGQVLARGEKNVSSTIRQLDILQQAEDKATQFFRAMLAQAGFKPSRCKIVYEPYRP